MIPGVADIVDPSTLGSADGPVVPDGDDPAIPMVPCDAVSPADVLVIQDEVDPVIPDAVAPMCDDDPDDVAPNTREAFGLHSTRGALGSNFGRSITMITREVLELEVRALLTDSSLHCRGLPPYRCCSERTAYLESRQRSAVVYSSISRFCFGILREKGVSARVDG